MNSNLNNQFFTVTQLFLAGWLLCSPVLGFAQSSVINNNSNSQTETPIKTTGSQATRDASSDWQFRLGAGFISTPRFIGSDKQRNLVFPQLSVRYQDWLFIDPLMGIGVETKLLPDLTVTAALGPDFTSRDSKDDPRLNGVTKIGLVPALKLSARYDVSGFVLGADVSSRIAKTEKAGTKTRFEAGYKLVSEKNLSVTAGGFQQLMDASYARNFLGISAAQSAITGLPAYDAKSGRLSNGLYLQAFYRIDEQWAVFSKLDLTRLNKNAANSPIVQTKNQTSAILVVSRSF